MNSWSRHFFENTGITGVEIERVKESKKVPAEKSFIYIKSGELRVVKAYVGKKLISESEFLERTGIFFKTKNLKAIGKRLSRVFGESYSGKFVRKVDLFINPSRETIYDGIFLVSPRFYYKVTGKKGVHGTWGEGTFVNHEVYLKGDFIVSEKISHDIVGYNIGARDEVLISGHRKAYCVLETREGHEDAQMNLQTLLNTWNGIGEDVIIHNIISSLMTQKESIINGEYLKMFEEIPELKNSFLLHEIGVRELNYREFRSLFKMVIGLSRSKTSKYIKGENGISLRFPFTGALRLHLTADILDHDGDGNAIPHLRKGNAHIHMGRLYVNNAVYKEMAAILQGADEDDSVYCLPDTSGDILVTRNPGLGGEWYRLHVVKGKSDVQLKPFAIKWDRLPKQVTRPVEEENIPAEKSSNEHKQDKIDMLIRKELNKHSEKLSFSEKSLRFFESKIEGNFPLIGVYSNAEFIQRSIAIDHGVELGYHFDVDSAIDSHNMGKDKAHVGYQIVTDFFEEVISKGLSIPISLLSRVPKKYRDKILINKESVIDSLVNKLDSLRLSIYDELNDLSNKAKPEGFSDVPKSKEAKDASKWYSSYNEAMKSYYEKYEDMDIVKDHIKGLNIRISNSFSRLSEEEKDVYIKKWLYLAGNTGKDSILWIDGIREYTLLALEKTGKCLSIEQVEDPITYEFWNVEVFGTEVKRFFYKDKYAKVSLA